VAAAGSKPLASFIVEWENALLCEESRSLALLHALRRQSVAAASSAKAGFETASPSFLFELLIVYDEAQFDGAKIAALIHRCAGAPDRVLQWRLLPTRDSGYYKNKNFGARAAAGEILLFIDSDVIPEEGWLKHVLCDLADPAIGMVAGSSYIEPAGLVGKTFALTWFFPLRSNDGPLQRVDSFFANNFAVRRDFQLQHPFPDLAGTSRGSCLILAKQLSTAGVPIYLNSRARVAHPAPHGLRHISKRALAQGRDRLYRERRFGTRWSASSPASCLRLARHCAGSAGKIATGFHRVGLKPLLIPAAIAVAWYYYLLYWTGEILAHAGLAAVYRIRV
jgi:hypothetical protein